MQEYDGEFYPEKNLDRNYKIPKTKRPAKSQEQIQTPLIIAEYESLDFSNNYPGSYSASSMAPIQQNIFNTLKAIKEKPKNAQDNIFQRTVPDILDDSLPKELKQLFQPLFCKLCDIQLSSNQTAKLHYNSKNHEKHIRKWLVDYSERTGEPLHRRATTTTVPVSESYKLDNPRWFYCEICDLELTGQQHAESHYMGKNHRKAMSGNRAPAGKGYYDNEGKWVRTKDQKRTYDADKGEDSFGLDFRKSDPDEPCAKKPKQEDKGEFYCEVCDVKMTSQIVLDSHNKGQKHLKKLKKSNEPDKPDPDDLLAVQPLNFYNDAFASYRTPSGQLYCQVCDVKANSQPQFAQHLQSKKHIKKEASKR